MYRASDGVLRSLSPLLVSDYELSTRFFPFATKLYQHTTVQADESGSEIQTSETKQIPDDFKS